MGIFSLIVLGVTFDAQAQTKRRPVIRKAPVRKAPSQNLFVVEKGKKFRVRMESTISSKTAKAGDQFTATVTEPVYSTNGAVVIPASSEVVGRVDSSKPAEKGGKPGQIDVSFIKVKLPNGKTHAINGSLTDLDSDDAKSDSEGTASGDKMKHRKIIFIGGGGAGGAILGAAIGGGKGALIGGLIGAGGGFLGERFTKGENAEVKAGTEFGVYLNQAISLPKFSEAVETADYDDSPSPSSGGTTYVVRAGDTLGKISQRFYGNTRDYLRIYDANRDRLSSPSSIEVGQELIIP